MKGAIAMLRVEIASDLRTFVDRVAELASVPLTDTTTDPNVLARVAVALHHAYGAVEGALARIAKVFETEPTGPNWHRSLLETMALEIPGARPGVLSTESLQSLRELLAFRHFFRHAYSVPLDAARLANLTRRAKVVQPMLQADFARLDAWLAELAKVT